MEEKKNMKFLYVARMLQCEIFFFVMVTDYYRVLYVMLLERRFVQLKRKQRIIIFLILFLYVFG